MGKAQLAGGCTCLVLGPLKPAGNRQATRSARTSGKQNAQDPVNMDSRAAIACFMGSLHEYRSRSCTVHRHLARFSCKSARDARGEGAHQRRTRTRGPARRRRPSRSSSRGGQPRYERARGRRPLPGSPSAARSSRGCPGTQPARRPVVRRDRDPQADHAPAVRSALLFAGRASGQAPVPHHQRTGATPPISGAQIAGTRYEADHRFGGEHRLPLGHSDALRRPRQ